MFSGAIGGPSAEEKPSGPAVVELSSDAEFVFECLLAAHMVMPVLALMSTLCERNYAHIP